MNSNKNNLVSQKTIVNPLKICVQIANRVKQFDIRYKQSVVNHLCLCRQSDVMVDELSPDDEENGDCVIVVTFVFVHVDGDHSG